MNDEDVKFLLRFVAIDLEGHCNNNACNECRYGDMCNWTKLRFVLKRLNQ